MAGTPIPASKTLIPTEVPGAPTGETMTLIHVICGVVALGLLVYLFAALLKPEKF